MKLGKNCLIGLFLWFTIQNIEVIKIFYLLEGWNNEKKKKKVNPGKSFQLKCIKGKIKLSIKRLKLWFTIMLNSSWLWIIVDGHGNTIAAEQAFFTGQFLEQTTSQTVYVLSNKNHTSLSVIYPFVQVIPNKKSFIITN